MCYIKTIKYNHNIYINYKKMTKSSTTKINLTKSKFTLRCRQLHEYVLYLQHYKTNFIITFAFWNVQIFNILTHKYVSIWLSQNSTSFMAASKDVFMIALGGRVGSTLSSMFPMTWDMTWMTGATRTTKSIVAKLVSYSERLTLLSALWHDILKALNVIIGPGVLNMALVTSISFGCSTSGVTTQPCPGMFPMMWDRTWMTGATSTTKSNFLVCGGGTPSRTAAFICSMYVSLILSTSSSALSSKMYSCPFACSCSIVSSTWLRVGGWPLPSLAFLVAVGVALCNPESWLKVVSMNPFPVSRLVNKAASGAGCIAPRMQKALSCGMSCLLGCKVDWDFLTRETVETVGLYHLKRCLIVFDHLVEHVTYLPRHDIIWDPSLSFCISPADVDFPITTGIPSLAVTTVFIGSRKVVLMADFSQSKGDQQTECTDLFCLPFHYT